MPSAPPELPRAPGSTGRPGYAVLSGGWAIGRIHETRGGPDRSALVLVVDRQRSDDTLGSRGDVGGGQGAVSEELGQVEGMGEADDVT
jgi:hypothetical protein